MKLKLMLGIFAFVSFSAQAVEIGDPFEFAAGIQAKDIDYLKDYQPSVLTTKDETSLVFRATKVGNSQKQCFNRAQTWSKVAEENYLAQYGKPLQLVKVFMFYSASFQARNRFNWWFHVAPAAFIRPYSGSKNFNPNNLVVFDRHAFHDPVPYSYWTDYFQRYQGRSTKRGCKLIRNYHEFTNTREDGKEDCYHLIVPMYYYTPDDFADLEKFGKGYRPLKWDE